MGRTALLLGGLCAALPGRVAASPSPPPGPSNPINFTILPGHQTPGQPTRRTFLYTLAPGQSGTDTVAVVNPSRATPLTVRLSVSDALTAPRGGGIIYNTAPVRHQIGRWLHLSTSTVTVAPYHITFVPVTLNLPASIRPGEYLGVINATNLHAATIRSGQLHWHVYFNRQALVQLRVTGRADAGLRVRTVRLTGAPSHAVLGLTLQNTGTVIDYPIATLLTIRGRTRTSTMRLLLGTVLGGDATALSVALDHAAPSGRDQVRVQVTYLASPVPGTRARRLQTEWNGTVVVPPGAAR